MKIYPLILLLFAPQISSETAEEAWIGLVGETASQRLPFSFVENEPDLPNVFIYGDSISIGYTPTVREELEGEANVYRLHRNGGDSSTIIQKVDTLHTAMKEHWKFSWDVIHLNVGLHDLKYVVGNKLDKGKGKQVSTRWEYEQNLRNAIGYFSRIAPDAKIIYATTTPVPIGEPGRHVIDAIRYNRVAMDLLKDYPEIVVNDLYTLTLSNQETWWTQPGNVHFNETGRAAQGKQVADHIREALARDS
tara:strand:- start:270 stop:1013 length:744 start_codon:yes stop_codon:yes gene_type:complete